MATVNAVGVPLAGSTGSGTFVGATSPTLVTPALGTPSSGTLTNATGLPEGGLSLTDITTNNATTTQHGFVKKLSNVATQYFDGTGNYSTPASDDIDATVDQTTQTVTMAVNTVYIANNAALVTLTLPATAAVGSWIEVIGLGAGGWLIAQAASQLIRVSPQVTTTGVGGSLASVGRFDAAKLRCIVTDTTWTVGSQQSQGLTFV